MGKRYEERVYHGELQKRCLGIIHAGDWVSVKNFRVRPEDKYRVRKDGSVAYRTECRACEYARRNPNSKRRTLVGYVPVSRYKPFMLELRNRVGTREAARRLGISNSTWYRWMSGDRKFAQRNTIAKLLRVLREVRLNNEVRHKRSIRRGAYLRGEVELIPTQRHHFVNAGGDAGAEIRRNYRNRNIEEERRKDRERRLKKRAMG